MKSTVAPYQTSVQCLRIVCANGTTIRLSCYPYDLKMSNGQVYETASGYDFSALVSETSFAAQSYDLEGFVGVSGITRDAIASGVLDGAECFLFATDFMSPVEDYEPIGKSILGKTTLEDDKYRIEEMGLVDLLNQSVGLTHTAQCPKTFGGMEYGGCKVDLTAIDVVGSVTSITSPRVFTDSSRAEPADHFGWGEMTFTSGQNAGLATIKIRDFSAGVFTLYDPPYYPLNLGDAYVATPGCRKRLVDCQRHNNVPRFGGDIYVPLGSTYRSVGGAT